MYGSTKPEHVSPSQVHICCHSNTIVFLNQVHSASTLDSSHWPDLGLKWSTSIHLAAHFDAGLSYSDDSPGSDIKYRSSAQLLWYHRWIKRKEMDMGAEWCVADQPRPSLWMAPRVLRWRPQPARAQMDQYTFAVQLVALFGDLVWCSYGEKNDIATIQGAI